MKFFLACLFALALFAPASRAQEIRLNGLADFRLFEPSDIRSNTVGGPGKTEWGSDQNSAKLKLAADAILLHVSVGITPEFRWVSELRADPRQKTAVDIIDSYFSWRPVSLTRWRWGIKAGVFFPPISLENDGNGWTTNWTLTPSAINSWVGDELRTIGPEGTIEWRGDVDHIQLSVSVFGWNEPTGVAIADRGWTFSGNAPGLFDHIRLPDAFAQQLAKGGRLAGPLYQDEYRQIDNTPGWYGAVTWENPDYGRLSVLRYDNEADPAAYDGEFGWRTKFWSLGYSKHFGSFLLLAQGMVGSSAIEPSRNNLLTTQFYAGYALLGWERDDWRVALRLDKFGTGQVKAGAGIRESEHGAAITAAVTWSPIKSLRLTAEVLVVDSWRDFRLLSPLGRPRAVEVQNQLAARVSF